MQAWTNALRLMRIPFSIYLMPMFWFACSEYEGALPWGRVALLFAIIHLLVYPASNGYNSYFDQDEDSIGGLKHPPKVSRELFWLVALFDVLSIGASLLVSWTFALGMLGYVLVSKAYSYDRIRLKQYPYLSTLVVTLFQGAYTFLLVQHGLGMAWESLIATPNLLLALVSTLFLCGSYPLTQVYQHQADADRGDITLSLKLGIRGTFLFAAASMFIATGLLMAVYFSQGEWPRMMVFLLATGPVVGIFGRWMWRVWKDEAAADFESTMLMNQVSSLCLSAAFLLMLWWG